MNSIAIPQVIVETPAYLRAIADIWDADTQSAFKTYIGLNYDKGDIIPNTNGLRKIRWSGSGHGKRGGARVIYYYYNKNHPIYLLFAYQKNMKDDLTEHEKKIMRQLVDRLKFALRNKE
ncbi:MAG: type II toxin-antitoxin system RelE/ParE family toxin, partial [Selenomonadaceae bacterium]|nr:type II toxin-antitoxin system RelE/ParE family toxin [Selenomonadaceae bacterium]